MTKKSVCDISNAIPDDVPEIEIDVLKHTIRKPEVSVFDVREKWEYQETRIPGVISVPMTSITDDVSQFEDAATGGPIYFVCGSGGRSSEVVQSLRNCGIDAINVAGGTKAWIKAGLPVETGDD